MRLLAATCLTLLVAAPAAAQSPMSPPPPLTLTGETGKLAADMQAVLDARAALGPKPVETLTPAHPAVVKGARDAQA